MEVRFYFTNYSLVRVRLGIGMGGGMGKSGEGATLKVADPVKF